MFSLNQHRMSNLYSQKSRDDGGWKQILQVHDFSVGPRMECFACCLKTSVAVCFWRILYADRRRFWENLRIKELL